MMMNLIDPIFLASSSPRRQQLLKSIGVRFEVLAPQIAEEWPGELYPSEVPEYLSKKKADSLMDQIKNRLVLAADTVVIHRSIILGKPEDSTQAGEMLRKLSGEYHKVVTGVCIQNQEKFVLFKDETRVRFKDLTDREIDYYLQHYRPLDKAGAYGIQEWLGMIGVTSIEGSFYNVMGLPLHMVYQALLDF